MTRMHRLRLAAASTLFLLLLAIPLSKQPLPELLQPDEVSIPARSQTTNKSALEQLETLAVKGRAPKTGYSRAQFGDGWQRINGCDMRNIILARDLVDERIDTACKVQSGTLSDPYTGNTVLFLRGQATSDDVQIDHVVALSNAWQTGAQQLSPQEREALANDPLELLAVDGTQNQAKGDGDAASWLPPNKAFRCQYVARQIDIKVTYRLWVTESEKQAMQRVLASC